MHQLLDGIPLDEMNTSMTINATAAWLLGLYVTVAEENGVERAQLKGTTQNDIIKEYLSRGTYAFPPEPSMRLIADMVAFTVNEVPSWNPTNICSYHLQEAGATPVQEIAYALSTGIAVLDEVKARGQVAEADFPKVFGRISFFVNAGIRLIEEIAKLRAMGRLWNEIGRERYGVTDEKMLRFRYGVQVNSLGLTEAQPENNIQRIVLEALAVTLSRDARARALQLPAWNEAMGLPRPWDQQWSLRIQQVLANETDLLEYPDIFEGSVVMDGLVEELTEGARAEMAVVEEHGGAVAAVPYMKARLVESHRERVARIETRRAEGDRPEQLHRERGLAAHRRRRRRHPHPRPRGRARADRGAGAVEGRARRGRRAGRARGARPGRRRRRRRTSCRRRSPPPRPARRPASGPRCCARPSAPTAARPASAAPRPPADREQLAAIRARVDEVSEQIGHRIKILVGKPGLDGHSNGSEQIALRARDAGMEVIYQGIRLTPEEIAESALQEDVDVVGLSILSGSHLELVPEVVRRLRDEGVDVPVVAGGIIPAGRRRAPARGRRRRRLHAEGLRHQQDHGRDRRPRRRARRHAAPPPERRRAIRAEARDRATMRR